MKSDAVRLWKPLPGESSKAFRAFRVYWELGPKRSLAAVTAVLATEKHRGGRSDSGDEPTKQRKNRKSGQVGVWSRKYAWNQRALEWDAQGARYYEQCRATEYRRMCERHLKQIRVAQVVLGRFEHEFARAFQERQHEFQALDLREQMKLVSETVRVVPSVQTAELDASGVKVVSAERGSDPEWHFHGLRVQGGFEEHPDLAFPGAGEKFGGTAEQLKEQVAHNSEMKPWDRQSSESARAYGAFCLYRDLGPERSLAEVTRRTAPARTAGIYVLNSGDERSFGRKRKSGQVGAWCRKFRWIERCQECDLYQTAAYKNHVRKDIEQMAERHAEQARLLLELQLNQITAATKSIARRRYDLAHMPISKIVRLHVKVTKLILVLQKCEHRARGVELDTRKEQARGSQWQNEFFAEREQALSKLSK